jgi:hypothetical protein
MARFHRAAPLRTREQPTEAHQGRERERERERAEGRGPGERNGEGHGRGAPLGARELRSRHVRGDEEVGGLEEGDRP